MAEGVVHLLEVVHVEVQERDALPGLARPRDRLLQQVLELHAVRDLGERVVAGEVADAPLGALAFGDVARDVDLAGERPALAVDRGGDERHRDGLAGPRAQHGLAEFARGRDRIRAVGGRVGEQCADVHAGEFRGGITGEALRRLVRDADVAIGRGHEHAVAHAVEHAVQVVAPVGGILQRDAHALEGIADALHAFVQVVREGLAEFTAADVVRRFDQRGDAAVDPALVAIGPPGRGGATGQRQAGDHHQQVGGPPGHARHAARPAAEAQHQGQDHDLAARQADTPHGAGPPGNTV
jgi:hypothetical protein